MRSINEVRVMRDKLTVAIDKLSAEITRIREEYGTFNEMPHEERTKHMRLVTLRQDYLNQRQGLYFILNEDIDLKDYMSFPTYKEDYYKQFSFNYVEKEEDKQQYYYFENHSRRY